MAKGNLFQGMARGKVGDVVFSRANGEQISRVRNRHPKNPRTNAQLFQRAIMATIVQAYAAGKEIFDHSFQGYSVGAQNQRKFISENAKILREAIATDINTPVTTNEQTGRIVAPGIAQPVPFAYVISKGTYKQNLFVQTTAGYKLPNNKEGEKVKDYAARVNLVAKDIYTIVAFVPLKKEVYTSATYDDVLASQKYCDFGYIRLTVKENLDTVEDVLLSYDQIFDIEQPSKIFMEAGLMGQSNISLEVSIPELLKDDKDFTTTGAVGIIRSRKDADLRSDSTLNVVYGSTAEDMFGIASDYLLDAWQSGTQSIAGSDLILEGGDV